MKNDYLSLYIFLFCLFLGIIFAFCYVSARYVRQSETDTAIIEDCRRELADSRATNNELNLEIERCRKRIEQTERELRETTERLRISNSKLADIAGVISESARLGATATDAITRAREIISGLDCQIEQIREIIQNQKLSDFYPDSD